MARMKTDENGSETDQDQSVQTGTVYKASSSVNGRYSIEEVPAGKYEITMGVDGFDKKDATVQPAQTTTVDFQFQPDYQ